MDNSNNDIAFVDHLIGYFDILGYTQMLNNEKKLNDVTNLLIRLEKLLKHELLNQIGDEVKTKSYMFSDNFCICIELSDETKNIGSLAFIVSFSAMLQLCLYTQYDLSIRGAITVGKLNTSLSDNLLLGKGIAEAYNIESNIAIYPRILISNEAMGLIKGDSKAFSDIILNYVNTSLIDLFVVNQTEPNGKCLTFIDFIKFLYPEQIKPTVQFTKNDVKQNNNPLDFVKTVICSALEISEKEYETFPKKFYDNTIKNLKQNKSKMKLFAKYMWYFALRVLPYKFDKLPIPEELSRKSIGEQIGINLVELNKCMQYIDFFSGGCTDNDFKALEEVLDLIPDFADGKLPVTV